MRICNVMQNLIMHFYVNFFLTEEIYNMGQSEEEELPHVRRCTL